MSLFSNTGLIFIFIGAIAWVFLIVISLFLSSGDNGGDFGMGMLLGAFITILTIAEILMIYGISKEPEPKAIDVYRNKTELEITSVNGVPRDTVVVWKNN